ncbi:MAG TPA: Lrp/AsnC family transcriptional regulator [Acidobacteria bacterium]|nr:Lrp/AsnC family transcriptional regulator [Acidobacteriota bacterium]
MDDIDRKILTCLQEDASLSIAEIGKRVGLSPSPCWRRIQILEKEGVIRKRVALLDPQKVNVGISVFVRLKTGRHDQQWLEAFTRAVAQIDEVVEIYRTSGDVDYLLRVVVPSIAGYDRVYKKLIAAADFIDVSGSFVIETLKQTTALPLDYVE